MIIKVPKEIKIGVHSYKVILLPNLKNDLGFQAALDQRLGQMEIDPAIVGKRRDVNLLHEVIHLIDIIYSCDIGEDNVDRLAQGIAELLFNNLNIEFSWEDIK